jgi:hypothetical protein
MSQGLVEEGHGLTRVLVARQARAQDVEVDERLSASDSEGEPVTGEVAQQRGLLGQRDRVVVGQHAHRRPDRQPATAEKERGHGDGRGVLRVPGEVVLGRPHLVPAASFGFPRVRQ